MHAGLKITAFAAGLAATFGTAYGVGKGVDPVVENPAPAHHESHREASPAPEGGGAHGGHEAEPPGGLQISERGYTLDLRTPSVPAGKRSTLSFVIRDSGGRAVTAYQREHEKELHLIVASRDLVTYRHLHPPAPPTAPGASPSSCPARAVTGSSPTSPRRRRAPRTSPSARTSRRPAPMPRRSCPPPTPRRRPTATRSAWTAACARARRAS